MTRVEIYTDGSCSGNPGPGGWGVILRYGDKEKEMSGGEAATTNNRMELTAVIRALETLNRPCEVDLTTDSQYIVRAINEQWINNWRKSGWKRKGGELKNVDLWKRLDELLNIHNVRFNWVKGHAENEYNNRCDMLATAQTRFFADK